jgi:hypothetical protein
VDPKAIEAELDELLHADEPMLGDMEAIGRAYHWLDRPDEARPWLLKAAEYYKTIPDTPGRVGGMLRLAGEDGREWFERALAGEDRTPWLAPLRYLVGDEAGALEAAERDPDQLPLVRGIAALVRDDVAEARKQFTAAINKERVKPWGDSSGDIGLYDWLEESYRRESELTGRPMPDHLTMLEGFGPKKARKRKAPDLPPPPGTRVEREGSLLEVDDEGDITITLPDGPITLVMWGGEYVVTVRGDELPARYKGFGEAIGAIGDERVRALADAAVS